MGISDKAMMGRNGFLFLNGNDNNDLLGHLQGEIPLREAALAVHTHNKEVIDGARLPFLGIIVPEAHCVYPELLPHGVPAPSCVRPISKVVASMATGYTYPIDLLLDYKASGGIVYTGRDSHWQLKAAYETYVSLRNRIGRTHDLVPTFDLDSDSEVGDLTLSNRSEIVAAERVAMLRRFQVDDLVFSSNVMNHGNVMAFHNRAGSGRCLAFGTSFSLRLLPAYLSDFEEVVFCYGTTVDPFMIDLVRPDFLISELPERFLHYPSFSIRGASLFSMLLGISSEGPVRSNLHPQSPRLPEHLRKLVTVLDQGARFSTAHSKSSFPRLLEDFDMDIALRAVLLRVFLDRPGYKIGIRQLLSGQFHSRLILEKVSGLIDTGDISLRDINLIANHENGLLSKVRLFIRSGLDAHAKKTLDECLSTFGTSSEAAYYQRYLKV